MREEGSRGMDSTGGAESSTPTDAGMHSTAVESSNPKEGACTDSTRDGGILPMGSDSTDPQPSVRPDSPDPIRLHTRASKSAKRIKKDEEAPVDSDSLLQEEAGNELGKGVEMMGITPETQVYADVDRALLHIQDKPARNTMGRETMRQLVKYMSNEFDRPRVESDKLLVKPAAHSATDSVTTLEHYYSLQHYEPDDEMAYQAKNFALKRSYWESAYGKTCGSFEHTTALSSMQFTHYTPGRSPHNGAASTPATLQIFSINLVEIAGGLGWPLFIYGEVAVRDVVDHNRNLLFSCDRDNAQRLTQNDSSLRLIGPSRAVVYTDVVNFEIQLKVKGATKSQDKALITEARDYHEVFGHGVTAVCFKNRFCMVELRVQIVRITTQATVLGVQVIKGDKWPFEYGARVACSSLPGKIVVTEDKRVSFVTCPPSGEVVMVDSKDGATLKGFDGYLHLPRNVISVESRGRLNVGIQAYSKSGDIALQDHVSFAPKFSKITRKKCFLGDVMVVITVAWSQVATDKRNVMALGCLV